MKNVMIVKLYPKGTYPEVGQEPCYITARRTRFLTHVNSSVSMSIAHLGMIEIRKIRKHMKR